MARVLLINPPSPERLGAPLLSLQYVAASLLEGGHQVKVIDAAARHFHPSASEIIRVADQFRPDMVAMALYTRWIWHAYELAGELRGRAPNLVAGGPHATARPLEVLGRGFDVVVTGEAEHVIARLAGRLERAEPLEDIPGIWFRSSSGAPAAGPPASFIEDLDRIPLPQDSQHLFDAAWYGGSDAAPAPGGILTSRGCPARCTFCANYVTGRGFRYRSVDAVVAELNQYHHRSGATFFPFWDDALTAHQPRLLELCAAFERLDFPLQWSAITRANMVTAELLAAMKRAGCVSVNFGVESGDDSILRAIKKGIATRHVVRALEWAKDLGLRTACNFMLGFPEDTPETLENTVRFMDRIAPLTDVFSTLGVVVPFPGTPLYDEHHLRFGFTDWWLKPEYAAYSEPPDPTDFDRFYRHYIDDANLDLDFFRYTPGIREWIRVGLRYKAEHNLRAMGLLTGPLSAPVSAA
jgi:radical SAM superfamily enzyme YgiQ (UPF0313 family)